MRRWIDILTQPPTAQTSFLKEFAGDNSRQLSHVEQALTNQLGALQRIGGAKRLYDVGRSGQRAALYVIGNSIKGLGLAWKDNSGVSTIYFWNTLNPFNDPDFEVDIPPTGNFDAMVPQIVSMLRSQRVGSVPVQVHESVELDEAKKTATEHDFFQMAQKMYGKRANNLSWADIQAVANKNNVLVPPGIRTSPGFKTSPTTWNLSGKKPDAAGEIGQVMGSSLEDPEPVGGFQSMLQLAKAKEIRRLAGQGQIYILGRKPSGAFFSVPGVAAYSAQMERMLANEISSGDEDQPTMEEQYKLLADKVALIASGKSRYIKSLLITGAPASGKSYNVMRTIEKDLGMTEGVDYIVSTGKLTPVELYRLLIEQVNGMIILDDSDGIVKDDDAMNMLKGALDTKPIREISYRVRGTINIAILPAAERDEYAMRLSRVMREQPDPSDAAYFARYARFKSARNTKNAAPPPVADAQPEDDGFNDLEAGFQDDETSPIPDEAPPPPDANSEEIFNYVMTHLPNKIDFKGRMIFVSNMERDEWPEAIISRADTVNMSFSDQEMLGFFYKIKDSFDAALSSAEKTEVLDYLKELWTMGKLNRTINFRLLQLCFDYRLVSGWRKLMAAL